MHNHIQLRRKPVTTAVAGALSVLSMAAQSQTVTVTNINDSGLGSLRQAIEVTAVQDDADTIVFDPALTGQTIILSSGEIRLGPGLVDSLTIRGPAAGDASGIVISGNNASRVLYDSRKGNLTLENMTITSGMPDFDGGGGVFSRGSLTLNHVVVTENATTGDFAEGGGIFASGEITLNDSIVNSNRTNGMFSRGGGVTAFSDLTLNRSVVTGNLTQMQQSYGGGVYSGRDIIANDSTISNNVTEGLSSFGGGLAALGDITINNSTISGNTTSGIAAFAGGLTADGQITLNQSTLSGNTTTGISSSGGGVFGFSDIAIIQSTIINNITFGDNSIGGAVFTYRSNLDISQSTIVANQAALGPGGIHAVSGGYMFCDDVIVNLENTIIAGNTGLQNNFDTNTNCGGSVTLNSINSLFGDSADEINGNNVLNIFSDNPGLGPLQDNGGPTFTSLPNPDSLSIDSGESTLAPQPFDQRGAGFSRIINSVVDIGAVEFELIADIAVTLTPSSDFLEPQQILIYTVVVQNNGPQDASDINVSFPVAPGLNNVGWQCAASTGSACGANSGTGSISEVIDLLNGGTVNYQLTASVSAAEGSVVNSTVSALAPEMFIDTTPENNTDTAITPVAVFISGFELATD